jgi:serine phosphatase RsbU (regulator of sigma subunit)
VSPFNEDDLHTMINVGRGQEAVPDDLGHYLVAIGGAQTGRCVEIGVTPLTIGRDPQQTLVFSADTEVSRRHTRVLLVDGQVVAEDLGSTNGTFVDAQRLAGHAVLREGSVLRVGRQFLRYERRRRDDVARAQELDSDLRRASSYVMSLLPAPIASGPVRTEWRLEPSAQLGGDGFGYYWLDPGTFVFYLIDVSGHGVGPAMHSVTVLNVLRQRALPDVNFGDPASVLSSLNSRFQMEEHGGLYFTIWYGVYAVDQRTLTYSSAGHHPAYLMGPDRRSLQPLGSPALMIGILPDGGYEVQRTIVPVASDVYLFSDGVFEIETPDQRRLGLPDFLPLIQEPALPGAPEPARLYQAVTRAAGSNRLDDDFTLMVVSFQ